MVVARDFSNEFDEEGHYRKGDGALDVAFVAAGQRHPGQLHFSHGNLVRATMDGGANWGYPDNSPLDGIRFHLELDGAPVDVITDHGRLVRLDNAKQTTREGRLIERAMAKAGVPAWVENWKYELGSDADGDEIVRITLFASEEPAPRRELVRFLSQFSIKLIDALTEEGSDLWPFVRVETMAEHKTA
jgi:hypothetical protein